MILMALGLLALLVLVIGAVIASAGSTSSGY